MKKREEFGITFNEKVSYPTMTARLKVYTKRKSDFREPK